MMWSRLEKNSFSDIDFTMADPTSSRIVQGESTARGEVIEEDKEVKGKNTDPPNTGAIKKKKLVKAAFSAEAPSTSMANKQKL